MDFGRAAMQELLDSSGLHVSASSTPSHGGASSVDALERVMHFTGAGADACFYADPSAPPSALTAAASSSGNLRYWLNPSVRTRQTIATCEIANLGAPYFSAASTALLRITVAPFFEDGRCFPTRCVLSLATSAQRLDALAVRPVVLQEWHLACQPSVAADGPSGKRARQTCSTTVPLRTLFHVASLMGKAGAAATGDVRLYLQLRFCGCTDASDTHRIAAVHLRYENIGSAAEVLSVLQRRGKRASSVAEAAVAAASSYGAARGAGGSATFAENVHDRRYPHNDSTFVEEVEVTMLSSSSSSSAASDVEVDESLLHTPLQRQEKKGIVVLDEIENSAYSSPPHRSATKPRTDAPSSTDTIHGYTSEVVRRGSHSGEGDTEKGTELVRVERTLRLPPPPPLTTGPVPYTTTTTTDARKSVVQTDEHTTAPSRGAPWPPRKTRTLVLAPSVSPSLTSTSASDDGGGNISSSSSSGRDNGSESAMSSYPGSKTKSTPHHHAAVTCPSAPLTDVRAEAQPAPHVVRQLESEAFSLNSPLSPPPRPQRSTSSDQTRRVGQNAASFSREDSVPDAAGGGRAESASQTAQTHPVHERTRSSPAVLWQATSLLGTAPWKLMSLQSSRRASPSTSARSSRASSRERSTAGAGVANTTTTMERRVWASAPAETPSQPQPASSISFSTSTSHFHASPWQLLTGKENVQQQQQQPQHSTWPAGFNVSVNSSFMDWRKKNEGDRELDADVGDAAESTSTASFQQWRTTFATGEPARANPQLRPPRSAVWPPFAATSSSTLHSGASQASSSGIHSTQPPSAYVPRLSLRSGNSQTSVPTQPLSNVAVNYQALKSVAGAAAVAAEPAFERTVPPSQNRDLWLKPKKTQAAVATQPPHVVADYSAEYGRPQHARRPTPPSQATTASPRVNADSFSSGPISVIPTSWLRARSTQPPRLDQSKQSQRSRPPRPADFLAEQTSVAPTDHTTTEADKTASRPATSPADTSMADSVTAAPAPPPSPPPPRRRALFHHATAPSTHSSRSTSAASSHSSVVRPAASPPRVMMTQRNDADGMEPTLPLKETDYHHRGAAHAANSNGTRRSRSAPTSRPSRMPAVVPPTQIDEVKPGKRETRTFSVMKHHASRNGVGRRRLTLRPALSAPLSGAAASRSEEVRVFLALEKVGGASQLRATLSRGDPTPACEVAIKKSDVVEVWTGVQAFHSGVIHTGKVHRPECCVVVRCNRQLVTAFEMESVDDVDAAYQLLLT